MKSKGFSIEKFIEKNPTALDQIALVKLFENIGGDGLSRDEIIKHIFKQPDNCSGQLAEANVANAVRLIGRARKNGAPIVNDRKLAKYFLRIE